jgi:hypothetical protein
MLLGSVVAQERTLLGYRDEKWFLVTEQVSFQVESHHLLALGADRELVDFTSSTLIVFGVSSADRS